MVPGLALLWHREPLHWWHAVGAAMLLGGLGGCALYAPGGRQPAAAVRQAGEEGGSRRRSSGAQGKAPAASARRASCGFKEEPAAVASEQQQQQQPQKEDDGATAEGEGAVKAPSGSAGQEDSAAAGLGAPPAKVEEEEELEVSSAQAVPEVTAPPAVTAGSGGTDLLGGPNGFLNLFSSVLAATTSPRATASASIDTRRSSSVVMGPAEHDSPTVSIANSANLAKAEVKFCIMCAIELPARAKFCRQCREEQ